MPEPFLIGAAISVLPLLLIIAYNDVRYRRIPNPYVLAVLLYGLGSNAFFNGLQGTISSLQGAAVAFGLMLILHIFGAMGAGDVKLFGAIGAVIGIKLVPLTFVAVVLTGGVLALIFALISGTMRTTLWRVGNILVGLMPGAKLPRYEIPNDRKLTVPYGVAIAVGTLTSLLFFRG
jgi:prepilin peptidase CpaA